MTHKEIVLSGYEAFAEGNMAKLGAQQLLIIVLG